MVKLAPLSAHFLWEYSPNSNLMIVEFDRRFLLRRKATVNN
ncbi:hypothetical protein VKI21_04085 [Cyanobacterium aponinum UTEX 3222]|uniref:Uncharacterized protein n=1 Tax=Cyanobacterium aponinum AL20115 TaxID=3090662 RepID=A0AAF0ZC55_9CHRO|nr:hypothetical protein [Cyanobacterium aponinum]WPF88289.1 hypothetical protein SAY89_16055 [Cyanobacterium aponinum AL20115]WRL42875.1 hypothetical protein VKI21_04085 [Cyanobacterium aponinum UTEX 3222]